MPTSEPALFDGADGATLLALPFALDAFIADLAAARRALLTRVPAAFTRDEWAYVMTALAPDGVLRRVEQSLGPRLASGGGGAEACPAPVRWIARPRGTVAIWAPGNVSLLAPLVMLAALASGNRVRVKGSARATDLTGALLDAVRDTPGAEGLWRRCANVEHAVFDRTDPRNDAWAAEADVRIVFGSDAAAAAVHARPHPVASVGLTFADRRSESWVEPAAVTDAMLRDLAAVFAIYGQAGCTSPARVVLLDATVGQAREFRDALAAVWPTVVRRDVPMHTASETTRAFQWARAAGWDAVRTPRNSAVLAVGDPSLERRGQGNALWVVPATVDEALASAPANLQTVGHAVVDASDPRWMQATARVNARRWVPIREMHHFGWTWDGEDWWRRLFHRVEWRA